MERDRSSKRNGVGARMEVSDLLLSGVGCGFIDSLAESRASQPSGLEMGHVRHQRDSKKHFKAILRKQCKQFL